MSKLVKRKPIASKPVDEKKDGELQESDIQFAHDASLPTYSSLEDIKADIPDEDTKTDIPLEKGELRPDLDEQLENLELETGEVEHFTDATITEEPESIDQAQAGAQKTSKFKTALGEVKHFAGGLIAHPYEGTKHYSIMRHSHGLVLYQGPTTSVAITVFSDQPLPLDRQLWLQKRGFSGRTGLKVGAALGTRSAWIDVTPSIEGTADLLPKNDERAWQRDIARFIKKTRKVKNLSNHQPYETDVVRIPHAAEDGYFRIVMCAGRKVLCPSPIFRYASSSLDPSTLRGASLSTLPLELGIRIGSMVGRNAANTAAHGAMQPAMTTVKSITQQYQFGGLTQYAATTAYDTVGVADQVRGVIDSVNQQYDGKRVLNSEVVSGEGVENVRVIGNEEGPQKPFPIRFSGKVIQGLGKDRVRLDAPTANLANVPAESLLRLSGVYFGWASISKTKVSKFPTQVEDLYENWHQAVIIVAAEQEKQLQVVEHRTVRVHVLRDFGEITFFETKVNIMLMAFIHPHPAIGSPSQSSPDLERLQDRMRADITITRNSLNRSAWAPDTVLERVKSESSSRSLTERMADARQSGQKQIDKVPIHRLGIRADSMQWKDELVGRGGICVKR